MENSSLMPLFFLNTIKNKIIGMIKSYSGVLYKIFIN